MNKKLITLAIAAAMVAPLAAAAETTLYGRIDHALVNADDDTERAWDVATNTTRIGVRGSEDLGNGLKAIFNAEWGFDGTEGGSYSSGSTSTTMKNALVLDANGDPLGGDENVDYEDSTSGGNLRNRVAYVGLTGGFGTVAIGRQWTPYHGAVNSTDVFNAIDTTASFRGAKYVTRTGNALAYVSPNFSGLTASLALVIDRGTGLGESDGIDGYNPAITYRNGPISLGASMLEYDKDLGAQDVWGISGAYNFGMFRVQAQYEDIDESDGTNNDDGFDEWALSGEADFGNNTVRALYGQTDSDSGDVDMDFYGVGFQHNFSSRTRIYAEYVVNDWSIKGDSDIKEDEFSLGLRHDF